MSDEYDLPEEEFNEKYEEFDPENIEEEDLKDIEDLDGTGEESY